MRRSVLSLGVVLIVLTFLSCVQQTNPVVEETMSTEADIEAVNKAIEAWIDNVNANDPDGLIGLTCSDLEVIPPGEHPVSDVEAQNLYRSFMEHSTVALKPTTTEVVVSGDWAFRRYGYELTLTPKDGGGPFIMIGHGIHMFKRQEDGSWCLAKDLWNSVPPPSDAP